MSWIVFALLFFGAGLIGPRFAPLLSEIQKRIVSIVGVMLAILCVLSTSFITIGTDEVGHLNRIYGGKSMPGGRIVAHSDEKGPRAEILPPGFHLRLLLNVLYQVEKYLIVEVPSDSYGYLIAKDGEPLKAGQTFASAFSEEQYRQMLDAEYFLSRGGQKGPQTSVLTPGKYRLNRYLWDIVVQKATEIEKGQVGAVKSNVKTAVNFGVLKAEEPKSCAPSRLHNLPGGQLSVPLVPVGCIGIWDQPLLPGRYYINNDAFTVIKVDTMATAWVYKGGYERRSIALEVDQDGRIKQTESKHDEPVNDEYADRAVMLKVEGWDIPQELRVLVQVAPEKAPLVVASVGGLKEVEDKIITPIIRSVARNVTGGGSITVDEVDNQGKLSKVTRPPVVLDLINHRDVLETAIESVVIPEGNKVGVDIKEVRFGDPAIPPELLVARQREQLAQQLAKAYQQEKSAQDERIKTENAKAMANQQNELVRADIEQQRALRLKEARQLEGEGERLKLEAIAQGQKQQALVLGENRVVELRKYELVIDRIFGLIEKNPDIVVKAFEHAGKLVPHTMISTGNGSSLEGSAAILGSFLNSAQKSEKK